MRAVAICCLVMVLIGGAGREVHAANLPASPVNKLSREFLEEDALAQKELSAGNSGQALTRYINFGERVEATLPAVRAGDQEDAWLVALEHNQIWKTTQTELRKLDKLWEQWRRLVTVGDGSGAQQQLARLTVNSEAFAAARSHAIGRVFSSVKLRLLDEFQECRLRTSPHRIIYAVYERVAGSLLRGQIVLQWAHTLLATEGQQEREQNNEQAAQSKTEYNITRMAIHEKALSALANENRDIWRCDPLNGHTSGTYTELTQLLQGYLENEKDMNGRGTCMQDCSYYEIASSMGCYYGYCKRQRKCRGKIVGCRYVHKDMTVCEADRASRRRYEYIEYENSITYGRNDGTCPSHRRVKVDSWWRWLFWHCSYCLCLCDDATSIGTDRYWSLRESVSNVAESKVVTGVRLVKKGRVIHLQIQQASLLPGGRVNASTANWVGLKSLDPSDRYTKKGTDFHAMSYEERDLDLDDLFANAGYIITGVKWHMIGAHLNLAVRATPFNWVTGRIQQPDVGSYWISNEATLSRSKVKLHSPDIPTRQSLASKPTSTNGMYVEFTHSDLEKDVGQSTVPYLDTQDVTSEPLAPLSGVGLYHKGQDGYGGYVAPKIITYDYAKHIHD